jgi:NADPH:quinone reductase
VAALIPNGGYAERVAVPESWLVPVADGITDDVAAGLLLQGLTAHALVYRCSRLEPGETVVVQAAAGGTGTLAVQLAKRAGGRVIALASSEEKRALAQRLGADASVDSRASDLREAILDANGGEPVDAVLEMTGGDTFEACLRALAPGGRLVIFGIASREQNQVSTGHLMRHSRAVIGFWLMQLIPRRELVAEMIADLHRAIEAGELEVVIGGVYPMSQARRAHEDIAARRTHGKLLLDPSS